MCCLSKNRIGVMIGFVLAMAACSGEPQVYEPNQNNTNNAINNTANNLNTNNTNNNWNNHPDAGDDVVDAEPDADVPPDVEVPWYEREDASRRDPFVFLVVSDTHVRIPGNPDDSKYDNQGNLDNNLQFVQVVNNELAHASFVAITGDLVGTLFSSNPDDYGPQGDSPAHRFRDIMNGLAIPWQAVLGNHDYEEGFTSEGISADDPLAMEEIWRRVVGMPPYYAIVYRGFRFLFLNSVRGDRYWDVCLLGQEETGCTGSFDAAQIQWLTAQLAQPEPVVMFFHHPVHSDSWYTVWSVAGSTFQVDKDDPFYAITESYAYKIKAIFVGHGHMWASDTLHETIQVYETCSIGDSRGNPRNIQVVNANPATGEISVNRL